MAERLRALVIAELCNPDWSSVPLEGWNHSRALARLADVHVVTHARNRGSLVAKGLVAGREFTALDTGRLDRPLAALTRVLGVPMGANRGWTVLQAVSVFSYYYFEQLLWRGFAARIRSGAFDLVHRLTPMTPAAQSLVARRCARAGIPFVLGPLNGGLPWPRGFGELRRREGEWLGYLRGAHRWLPCYRSTRESAAAILAGSRQARAELAPRYEGKTVYVPENAVDHTLFAGRRSRDPVRPPLRLVFVGRLVPLKSVDMLLDAAAPLLRSGKAILAVIGDGPELAALREQAMRLAIVGGVHFTGWLAREEVSERLAAADVFAFPSIRDLFPAVVLEAMAAGVVPVVVDYGGPGEAVSPATGFVVPIGSRSQIVAGLREALEHLAAQPSLVRPIGERARQRVLRSFTWEAKAAQVVEVYRWVRGLRDKPDFGMPLDDPPTPDRTR